MEPQIRRVSEGDLHELAIGTIHVPLTRRQQIEGFLGGPMSLERGLGLVAGLLHELDTLRTVHGSNTPATVALEETVAVLAERLTSPNQAELRPLYDWAKQQFTVEELQDRTFLEGPFIPLQEVIAEIEAKGSGGQK